MGFPTTATDACSEGTVISNGGALAGGIGSVPTSRDGGNVGGQCCETCRTPVSNIATPPLQCSVIGKFGYASVVEHYKTAGTNHNLYQVRAECFSIPLKSGGRLNLPWNLFSGI